MFEELHLCSRAVARHLSAPFAEERGRYVTYCAERGDSLLTLTNKANKLIHVALQLSQCPNVGVAVQRLSTVDQGRGGRDPAWARFDAGGASGSCSMCGRGSAFWAGGTSLLSSCRFRSTWMSIAGGCGRCEACLTEQTCIAQRQYAVQFLRWYGGKRRGLIDLRPLDIDRYLAEGGATRWCRLSVRDVATALRGFLRFGANQGWSPRYLAETICAPRIYADEKLPAGPDWADMKRLLAAAHTNNPRDVCDRPILMLFAIYGLRATEVAQLRLGDLDWEHDLLHVRRVKRRGRQSYPLLPSMREALSRYLKTVRRHSTYQEVSWRSNRPSCL